MAFFKPKGQKKCISIPKIGKLKKAVEYLPLQNRLNPEICEIGRNNIVFHKSF